MKKLEAAHYQWQRIILGVVEGQSERRNGEATDKNGETRGDNDREKTEMTWT